MTIRLAHIDDIRRIDNIYNQAIAAGEQTAHTEPYTSKQRTEWFKAHSPDQFPIFVAEIDGIIAGFAFVSPYRHDRKALNNTAILSAFVDIKMHRKGIGKALIIHMEEACKEIGIRNLFGIIIETNTPSIELMKKCGYTQWAHLPLVAEFDGKEVGQVYYGKRID
ncbi:MAG: N-acetyltransferase [Marinilabiliales bacterium]|mgnify:CR=1 FL=1|nr:MAG: N-acetyltransferase [Marinilabiliales bacterium]